jgi:hypothetical protein
MIARQCSGTYLDSDLTSSRIELIGCIQARFKDHKESYIVQYTAEAEWAFNNATHTSFIYPSCLTVFRVDRTP